MKYPNIREEELKNKIAQNYFWLYDTTKIIGNIDFCVAPHQEEKELTELQPFMWAEAKKGVTDIYKALVQLIITIGKAYTFKTYNPPALLGAFDAQKIAFIPYSEILDVFYMNDFNWNVTPSNHNTKEFQLVYEKVKHTIDQQAMLFDYETDDKQLKRFIKNNFVLGKHSITKNPINKNNFMTVYDEWLEEVKPTIKINWEKTKKVGIIDGDFYLADLLSQENTTLKEKLFVLLKTDHYVFDRKIDDTEVFKQSSTNFNDDQVAHTQFWNKFERPPKEEYWDYIVERRDLLVPQDIRERKGSYFTPRIWVKKSQEYIADVLGEDWQTDYYVWDCAAGTGNLLVGLTEKYNLWASTIDTQDVNSMHSRINAGNLNLLENHVFQFDFLNDPFTKLPQPLQDIINDPKKRQKLLIYINPPYAEAGSAKAIMGTGKRKSKTTTENKTYLKYKGEIGKASNELFAQFLFRIYAEISGCKIANFSKLKNLQSYNFKIFRTKFLAKLETLFLAPAKTFDNVTGQFPIGFFVWDTGIKEVFTKIQADVFNENNKFLGKKDIYGGLSQNINRWIKLFDDKQNKGFGYMSNPSTDFQQNNYLYLSMNKGVEHVNFFNFTYNNLVEGSIYFSVRHCIAATWLNDRDQFLYPKDGWQSDTEFQNDCLAFTLFHGQNRITATEGTNHWIPFTEEEVNAQDRFESRFMTDFIQGKLKPPNPEEQEGKTIAMEDDTYLLPTHRTEPLVFSAEAMAVFEAGKALWQYYHQQPKVNVNASLYDIRAYFQGRNAKGQMNSRSDDVTYTELIGNLRNNLEQLAQKIEPKVYEYEFLRR